MPTLEEGNELAGGADFKSQESTVLNSELLSIYPNPNNGTFTVTSTHAGTYYLMNEMGQLVQMFTLTLDNNYSANVTGLGKGFYVISGQNEFGISKQKVVVGE